MRRSSLCRVVVALSLAACAGRTPVAGISPIDAPAPVDIRLYQPHGRTISFALSRPAYVAVFEIVPGQGVSLLYPASYDYAATHSMDAGFNVAQLPLYNLGRTYYLASFSRSPAQPTFLYAIASESPLDIDEIARQPSALRKRIGFNAFAQGFSQQIMDRLDAAVVPAQPDEAWATDYLVLWPQPEAVAPRVPPSELPSVLIVCRDGRQLLIDPMAASIATWCKDPKVVNQPPATPRDSGATGEPKDTTGKAIPPTSPAKIRAEPGKRAPAAPSVVVDYGTPRAVIGRAALERGRAGGGTSWAERETARWEHVPSPSGAHRAMPRTMDDAGYRPSGAAMGPRQTGDAGPVASAPRPQPAPSHDPTPGGNTSRSDSPRPGATQRAQ